MSNWLSTACASRILRHRARHGIAIRTIGSHRVVRISYSKDARDERDFVAYESVWVSLSVHPLVVVANDSSDIEVIVNLGENAFPDLRMSFHQPSLLKRERARFFEETCRKSNLPDVVHEATCMGKKRLGLSQTKTRRYVTGVNRYSSGVASGVPISGVERGDQCRSEGQVCAFEVLICLH